MKVSNSGSNPVLSYRILDKFVQSTLLQFAQLLHFCVTGCSDINNILNAAF